MELKERLYILAQDTGSMSDLHEYMVERLKTEIVQKVLNRQDVSGYAEAKSLIDSVFSELKTQGTIQPPYVNENV